MQPVPRHIIEPVQLDSPGLDMGLQCFLEALAFEFDIERRQSTR